jgi:hypothetical protein
MTSYSVRCRHKACRVRRVVRKHPDDMQAEKCPSCGHTKGWRLEEREYNRRNLCTCSGPEASQALGKNFPHRTSHPLCDHHPQGPYNQAKIRGVADEDIPLEHLGAPCTTDTPPF